MFSSKTCKNFQNTFFTEHQWWLLLNNPNRILRFNKNNKVNYIKLNKHPKIFIMNITVSKASFWDFLIRKSNGKYSTFLNFIASVSWTNGLDSTALLPVFWFAGKNGNESGFSKYINLSPRRNHFSSWLSLKESSVEWIQDK